MKKTKPLLVFALLLAILVMLASLAYLGYYAYLQCWFGHSYNDAGRCERCNKSRPVEDKPIAEQPNDSAEDQLDEQQPKISKEVNRNV